MVWGIYRDTEMDQGNGHYARGSRHFECRSYLRLEFCYYYHLHHLWVQSIFWCQWCLVSIDILVGAYSSEKYIYNKKIVILSLCQLMLQQETFTCRPFLQIYLAKDVVVWIQTTSTDGMPVSGAKKFQFLSNKFLRVLHALQISYKEPEGRTCWRCRWNIYLLT